MEKLIPELYKSYGTYVNQSKMLPNSIDGLLPVQKRILLGAHSFARRGFVKTAKLLGEVMANWHPHSEASGTAHWAVENGFMDGDGFWGSRIGVSDIGPAAPRYTKIKANDFVEEMAFKLVDYVVWEADELDPEPVIIPTMLPFCLITKYEITSIAFGFKTEIPCYNPADLIKRLLFLLKKGDRIIPKPSVPGCKILSSNEECEKLFTEGNGKIDIQGTFLTDEKNQRVYIRGWNPRISFDTLLNKIDKFKNYNLLSNNDIGFLDESNKKNGTRIRFEIMKQRNKEVIFNQMVPAITESLKSSLSYNIITVDSTGKIQFSPIDRMLIGTYNHYQATLGTYYKKNIEDIKSKIDELEIIRKIRPHISTALSKSDNPKEVCEILSEKTKIEVKDIEGVVEKHRIKKLMTVSTDISEWKNQLLESDKALKDLTNVSINKYKELEKAIK
jgi:DNA gyrase/topoisomerase IV subunit A